MFCHLTLWSESTAPWVDVIWRAVTVGVRGGLTERMDSNLLLETGCHKNITQCAVLKKICFHFCFFTLSISVGL